jgi:hypothetical protein
VTGMGVFETLKEVSKVTLLALKKRLARGSDAPATAPRPAAPRPAAAPAPVAPPLPSTPQLRPQGQAPAQQPSAAPLPRPAAPAASAPAAPPLPSTPQLRPQSQAQPQVAPPAAPAPAPPRPAAAPPPPPPASARPKAKSSMDVLGELEKLRTQALSKGPAAGSSAAPAAAPASSNGRGELSHNIEMTLKRADFQRARRLLLSFQVEDGQNQVVEAVHDLQVDITDAAHLEKLLLRLNIAFHAKE